MAFYGSFVLAGMATLAVVLGPLVVAREERGLEAKFGEAYREYRRTTPRWFGKGRR
jgi:protein-S-isoprenylcysteine O-methyltransferase Ste14